MQGIYNLHTWNKPCFYGTQCCSCSVVALYATCSVISPAKYVSYLHISTSHSLCAEHNMALLLQFLTFLLSWYVAEVLSEWFWNGSSRPYFYGYHFSIHIPAASVHGTTSCKHSIVLLRMGEIIARNMLNCL